MDAYNRMLCMSGLPGTENPLICPQNQAFNQLYGSEARSSTSGRSPQLEKIYMVPLSDDNRMAVNFILVPDALLSPDSPINTIQDIRRQPKRQPRRQPRQRQRPEPEPEDREPEERPKARVRKAKHKKHVTPIVANRVVYGTREHFKEGFREVDHN